MVLSRFLKPRDQGKSFFLPQTNRGSIRETGLSSFSVASFPAGSGVTAAQIFVSKMKQFRRDIAPGTRTYANTNRCALSKHQTFNGVQLPSSLCSLTPGHQPDRMARLCTCTRPDMCAHAPSYLVCVIEPR